MTLSFLLSIRTQAASFEPLQYLDDEKTVMSFWQSWTWKPEGFTSWALITKDRLLRSRKSSLNKILKYIINKTCIIELMKSYQGFDSKHVSSSSSKVFYEPHGTGVF